MGKLVANLAIYIAIRSVSVQERDIQIAEATAAEIETVRRLFRAYARSLPFSLDFQGFAAELAACPSRMRRPSAVCCWRGVTARRWAWSG
jgi:hypothetical protein